MSRDKRDAERAARRAKRLAERAEERAHRKEQQAERAERRAARLADQVERRPSREKDLDASIEDLIDQVTEKAEAWIDETTQRIFEPGDKNEIRRAEQHAERARREAEQARHKANRAEQTAAELSDMEDDFGRAGGSRDDDYEASDTSGRQRRRRHRQSRSSQRATYGSEFTERGSRRGMRKRARERARRRKTAHLYRDRQRKKILGVCAGVADYFGRPTWEIRLYAVLGLFFAASITIPVYFVTYFLMDDKPYYRRVTDRFDELTPDDANMTVAEPLREKVKRMKVKGAGRSKVAQPDNAQTMRTAKQKFSDIEQRLRQMETHVTSSRFELQRELKKISGED